MSHSTLVFDDKPKEECGVVGIYSPNEEAARKTYFALYALQHRGQESAGIASVEVDQQHHQMHHYKQVGLVSQVFNEETLSSLKGHMAVGHNRYATSGSKSAANAGPYVFNTVDGMLAVSHNGNITNAKALRQDLLARGVALTTNTDSELLALLIAAPLAPDVPMAAGEDVWIKRLERLLGQAQGAYCLTVLTQTGVYAVRDGLGLRPLCVGSLPQSGGAAQGYVIASESCALDTLGAKLQRDVQPGEVLRIDSKGLTAFQTTHCTNAPKALCSFEYVYFSRPDSVIEGRNVHLTRQALGAQLALESPELTTISADLVVPVPDSSIPAALGFANHSGIPFGEGFTKSRYIGRTFIAPDQTMRQLGVRMKFNPLASSVCGKRIVLIDDSIVRGNTIAPLIKALREAGAREVHVRVSAPPVRHPCFMGVDMARREELIANQIEIDRLAAHVGADSLKYLSLSAMLGAITRQSTQPTSFCHACFSGKYPLEIEDWGIAGEESF